MKRAASERFDALRHRLAATEDVTAIGYVCDAARRLRQGSCRRSSVLGRHRGFPGTVHEESASCELRRPATLCRMGPLVLQNLLFVTVEMA